MFSLLKYISLIAYWKTLSWNSFWNSCNRTKQIWNIVFCNLILKVTHSKKFFKEQRIFHSCFWPRCTSRGPTSLSLFLFSLPFASRTILCAWKSCVKEDPLCLQDDTLWRTILCAGQSFVQDNPLCRTILLAGESCAQANTVLDL